MGQFSAEKPRGARVSSQWKSTHANHRRCSQSVDVAHPQMFALPSAIRRYSRLNRTVNRCNAWLARVTFRAAGETRKGGAE